MTAFPVTRLFSTLASPIGAAATEADASRVLGEPAIFARQLHPEVFETIEELETAFGADLSTGKATRVPISGGWMALRAFWRPLPRPGSTGSSAQPSGRNPGFFARVSDEPADLASVSSSFGADLDNGIARLVPTRDGFFVEMLQDGLAESPAATMKHPIPNLPVGLSQGSLLAELEPAELPDGSVCLVLDEGDGRGFQGTA